ncbi:MAG: hypothetical protein COV76_05350, partial [Candidatus Omnitrophica bacterium CG11_big_fil_rev_8_21_14_0_20_64_10]
PRSGAETVNMVVAHGENGLLVSVPQEILWQSNRGIVQDRMADAQAFTDRMTADHVRKLEGPGREVETKKGTVVQKGRVDPEQVEAFRDRMASTAAVRQASQLLQQLPAANQPLSRSVEGQRALLQVNELLYGAQIQDTLKFVIQPAQAAYQSRDFLNREKSSSWSLSGILMGTARSLGLLNESGKRADAAGLQEYLEHSGFSWLVTGDTNRSTPTGRGGTIPQFLRVLENDTRRLGEIQTGITQTVQGAIDTPARYGDAIGRMMSQWIPAVQVTADRDANLAYLTSTLVSMASAHAAELDGVLHAATAALPGMPLSMPLIRSVEDAVLEQGDRSAIVGAIRSYFEGETALTRHESGESVFVGQGDRVVQLARTPGEGWKLALHYQNAGQAALDARARARYNPEWSDGNPSAPFFGGLERVASGVKRNISSKTARAQFEDRINSRIAFQQARTQWNGRIAMANMVTGIATTAVMLPGLHVRTVPAPVVATARAAESAAQGSSWAYRLGQAYGAWRALPTAGQQAAALGRGAVGVGRTMALAPVRATGSLLHVTGSGLRSAGSHLATAGRGAAQTVASTGTRLPAVEAGLEAAASTVQSAGRAGAAGLRAAPQAAPAAGRVASVGSWLRGVGGQMRLWGGTLGGAPVAGEIGYLASVGMRIGNTIRNPLLLGPQMAQGALNFAKLELVLYPLKETVKLLVTGESDYSLTNHLDSVLHMAQSGLWMGPVLGHLGATSSLWRPLGRQAVAEMEVIASRGGLMGAFFGRNFARDAAGAWARGGWGRVASIGSYTVHAADIGVTLTAFVAPISTLMVAGLAPIEGILLGEGPWQGFKGGLADLWLNDGKHGNKTFSAALAGQLAILFVPMASQESLRSMSALGGPLTREQEIARTQRRIDAGELRVEIRGAGDVPSEIPQGTSVRDVAAVRNLPEADLRRAIAAQGSSDRGSVILLTEVGGDGRSVQRQVRVPIGGQVDGNQGTISQHIGAELVVRSGYSALPGETQVAVAHDMAREFSRRYPGETYKHPQLRIELPNVDAVRRPFQSVVESPIRAQYLLGREGPYSNSLRAVSKQVNSAMRLDPTGRSYTLRLNQAAGGLETGPAIREVTIGRELALEIVNARVAQHGRLQRSAADLAVQADAAGVRDSLARSAGRQPGPLDLVRAEVRGADGTLRVVTAPVISFVDGLKSLHLNGRTELTPGGEKVVVEPGVEHRAADAMSLTDLQAVAREVDGELASTARLVGEHNLLSSEWRPSADGILRARAINLGLEEVGRRLGGDGESRWVPFTADQLRIAVDATRAACASCEAGDWVDGLLAGEVPRLVFARTMEAELETAAGSGDPFGASLRIFEHYETQARAGQAAIGEQGIDRFGQPGRSAVRASWDLLVGNTARGFESGVRIGLRMAFAGQVHAGLDSILAREGNSFAARELADAGITSEFIEAAGYEANGLRFSGEGETISRAELEGFRDVIGVEQRLMIRAHQVARAKDYPYIRPDQLRVARALVLGVDSAAIVTLATGSGKSTFLSPVEAMTLVDVTGAQTVIVFSDSGLMRDAYESARTSIWENPEIIRLDGRPFEVRIHDPKSLDETNLSELRDANVIYTTTQGLLSGRLNEIMGMSGEGRAFGPFRGANILIDEVDVLKMQPDLQASTPGGELTLASDAFKHLPGEVHTVMELLGEVAGETATQRLGAETPLTGEDAVRQHRDAFENNRPGDSFLEPWIQTRVRGAMADLPPEVRQRLQAGMLTGDQLRHLNIQRVADVDSAAVREVRFDSRTGEYELELEPGQYRMTPEFNRRLLDKLQDPARPNQIGREGRPFSTLEQFRMTPYGEEYLAVSNKTAQVLYYRSGHDYAPHEVEGRLVPADQNTGTTQADLHWNDPYQAAVVNELLAPRHFGQAARPAEITLDPVSVRVSIADVFAEILAGHAKIAAQTPGMAGRRFVLGYSGTGVEGKAGEVLELAFGLRSVGIGAPTNLVDGMAVRYLTGRAATPEGIIRSAFENGSRWIVDPSGLDARAMERAFHTEGINQTRLVRDGEGLIFSYRPSVRTQADATELSMAEAQYLLADPSVRVYVHRAGSRGLDLKAPEGVRMTVVASPETGIVALEQAVGRYRGEYQSIFRGWDNDASAGTRAAHTEIILADPAGRMPVAEGQRLTVDQVRQHATDRQALVVNPEGLQHQLSLAAMNSPLRLLHRSIDAARAAGRADLVEAFEGLRPEVVGRTNAASAQLGSRAQGGDAAFEASLESAYRQEDVLISRIQEAGRQHQAEVGLPETVVDLLRDTVSSRPMTRSSLALAAGRLESADLIPAGVEVPHTLADAANAGEVGLFYRARVNPADLPLVGLARPEPTRARTISTASEVTADLLGWRAPTPGAEPATTVQVRDALSAYLPGSFTDHNGIFIGLEGTAFVQNLHQLTAIVNDPDRLAALRATGLDLFAPLTGNSVSVADLVSTAVEMTRYRDFDPEAGGLEFALTVGYQMELGQAVGGMTPSLGDTDGERVGALRQIRIADNPVQAIARQTGVDAAPGADRSGWTALIRRADPVQPALRQAAGLRQQAFDLERRLEQVVYERGPRRPGEEPSEDFLEQVNTLAIQAQGVRQRLDELSVQIPTGDQALTLGSLMTVVGPDPAQLAEAARYFNPGLIGQSHDALTHAVGRLTAPAERGGFGLDPARISVYDLDSYLRDPRQFLSAEAPAGSVLENGLLQLADIEGLTRRLRREEPELPQVDAGMIRQAAIQTVASMPQGEWQAADVEWLLFAAVVPTARDVELAQAARAQAALAQTADAMLADTSGESFTFQQRLALPAADRRAGLLAVAAVAPEERPNLTQAPAVTPEQHQEALIQTLLSRPVDHLSADQWIGVVAPEVLGADTWTYADVATHRVQLADAVDEVIRIFQPRTVSRSMGEAVVEEVMGHLALAATPEAPELRDLGLLHLGRAVDLGRSEVQDPEGLARTLADNLEQFGADFSVPEVRDALARVVQSIEFSGRRQLLYWNLNDLVHLDRLRVLDQLKTAAGVPDLVQLESEGQHLTYYGVTPFLHQMNERHRFEGSSFKREPLQFDEVRHLIDLVNALARYDEDGTRLAPVVRMINESQGRITYGEFEHAMNEQIAPLLFGEHVMIRLTTGRDGSRIDFVTAPVDEWADSSHPLLQGEGLLDDFTAEQTAILRGDWGTYRRSTMFHTEIGGIATVYNPGSEGIATETRNAVRQGRMRLVQSNYLRDAQDLLEQEGYSIDNFPNLVRLIERVTTILIDRTRSGEASERELTVDSQLARRVEEEDHRYGRQLQRMGILRAKHGSPFAALLQAQFEGSETAVLDLAENRNNDVAELTALLAYLPALRHPDFSLFQSLRTTEKTVVAEAELYGTIFAMALFLMAEAMGGEEAFVEALQNASDPNEVLRQAAG